MHTTVRVEMPVDVHFTLEECDEGLGRVTDLIELLVHLGRELLASWVLESTRAGIASWSSARDIM
jgi:hypothetical protein